MLLETFRVERSRSMNLAVDWIVLHEQIGYDIGSLYRIRSAIMPRKSDIQSFITKHESHVGQYKGKILAGLITCGSKIGRAGRDTSSLRGCTEIDR